MKIVYADTPLLLQHAITLSSEFVTGMIDGIRENFPDMNIAELISEHDYDDVSQKFPGEHVPPYGRLLLVMDGDEAVGCIALAKMSDSICEMRTLYVRPAYRGTGVAKLLVDTIVSEGRDIGYTHMRLDTLKFMHSALRLYRSLGFYNIAPYRDVSTALQQYMCFLELDLRG